MIVIIHANNKKEAIKIAFNKYQNPIFISVFRYASKGNNFYQFSCESEKQNPCKN